MTVTRTPGRTGPVAFQDGGSPPQLYYHDCSGRISGHTTRAPPVGFKLETNGFQLYAIANLDKKSLSAASDTGYGPGET